MQTTKKIEKAISRFKEGEVFNYEQLSLVPTEYRAAVKALGRMAQAYDWQIFIPSINKTVFVSDIISEKKTGKKSYGIFSLDKVGNCTNSIFSAKMDNQIINFPYSAGYYLFIRN